MNFDQLPDGVSEQELLEIYLQAARDNVAAMSAALSGLATPPAFPDLATLHRRSHSLKGSSYQFGFTEPGHVAQAMEHFVARLLQAAEEMDDSDRSLLAEGLREITLLLDEIEEGRSNHSSADLCERIGDRPR